MTQGRALPSGITLTFALALAAFSACKGDSTADLIDTSQKECALNLDCEIEGQECATEGPRAGTCTPTLCAAPTDCLDTETCVSNAGEDLGWCLTALEAGDPCSSTDDRKFACVGAETSPQVLTCEGGTWGTAYTCPEGQPCYGSAMGRAVLTCGTDDWLINYAVEGWPCEAEQSAACTFDQGAILNCQVGTWQFSEMCSSSGRRCERVNNGEMGITCANGGSECLVCL